MVTQSEQPGGGFLAYQRSLSTPSGARTNEAARSVVCGTISGATRA